MKQTNLFSQFPPVTTKKWLDKITADLKGADFNRKLVRKTNEGFDVMPFYRREDLEKINYMMDLLPFLKVGAGAVTEDTIHPQTHQGGLNSIQGKSPSGDSGVKQTGRLSNQPRGAIESKGSECLIDNSWHIRQNIEVEDYIDSNLKALSLAGKGIDSIGFVISDPDSINEQNLRILLRNINPLNIEINFQSAGKAREIISLLVKFCNQNGYDHSALRGCMEADPLGRLMVNGTLCIPVEDGFDYLANLTRDALALPHYRNLQVNGSNFKNAGSDSVQELAFSISMAVEYLAMLTDRGINSWDAAGKIRFSFGTGSDYFMEIAKLRAARILWSVISEGYGQGGNDSFRMEIHCVTNQWNTTVYDPYINMLRTQTEAMSAVVGGTDSLTVNPFDIAFRRPGEFSERIARNQQLILKEEAYFDKVIDPAGGSYYIENLTALIAENSWKLFLEIEEKGGFLAALRSGFIQEKLAVSNERRIKDVADRKEVLVGTNKYPGYNEAISTGADPQFKNDGQHDKVNMVVEPIVFSRGAEEIEKIRIAVDRASRRPKVFMLTIGNPVIRRARSQYSAGFFGCAGYEITDNEGFASAAEGADAALKSGAEIVVICSSDEEYPVVAPEIFRRLKGRTIVVVAGNPESIEELRAAGIVNFISLKSNLCDTLRLYNSLLGIKDK